MPAPVITISPENHIDLPQEIHEHFRWEAGQELLVIRRETGVFLCPPTTREEMHGIARGANTDTYRDGRDRY
ncbi:hypothetical protein CDN99_10270 [Roseateles aquatilis]|uniref:AbrB family transcriptional regulator n=1 Tax=Roseateles aquatilis TaxID=431061 RepID=A0A246JFY8_9BURK|nr:AbrB family transcriptional regulator [Roseateles aquatilis]OWQ91519.1 hypothetical protein CDN99_10270 [Roseateles aquatilis]